MKREAGHKVRRVLSFRPTLLLISCLFAGFGPREAAAQTPNILIVVIDDLGIEHVGPHFQGVVPTPNLRNLAADGLVFERAWAYPFCSPTRAAIHTGRYPLRTGVGEPIGADTYELALSETTLADLVEGTYATAAFGKWHLGSRDDHPEDAGWDHYEVHHAHTQPGLRWNWFEHVWTVNGVNETRTGYMPEVMVNTALTWIGEQTEPWMVWLAPLSVHEPFHCPPSDLHSFGDCAPGDPMTEYHAAIEALDTLLQPVFAAVDLEDTTIFVVSDNGNPDAVALDPAEPGKVKGTVYQGGVHVPMFITGQGVLPGSSSSLVSVTDIFATVAGLVGAPLPPVELDSVDLAPILADPSATIHNRLFTETFSPNGSVFPHDTLGFAARDDRYKLTYATGMGLGLYDLELDPYEAENLMSGELEPPEQAALDDLRDYVRGLKVP